MRERGLDLDRPTLFVIAGGTGAQGDSRNVLEHLREALRPRIRRALAEAYALNDPDLAARRVTQLAPRLDSTHPGAAASLRGGRKETLTLQCLGVTGAL